MVRIGGAARPLVNAGPAIRLGAMAIKPVDFINSLAPAAKADLLKARLVMVRDNKAITREHGRDLLDMLALKIDPLLRHTNNEIVAVAGGARDFVQRELAFLQAGAGNSFSLPAAALPGNNDGADIVDLVMSMAGGADTDLGPSLARTMAVFGKVLVKSGKAEEAERILTDIVRILPNLVGKGPAETKLVSGLSLALTRLMALLDFELVRAGEKDYKHYYETEGRRVVEKFLKIIPEILNNQLPDKERRLDSTEALFIAYLLVYQFCKHFLKAMELTEKRVGTSPDLSAELAELQRRLTLSEEARHIAEARADAAARSAAAKAAPAGQDLGLTIASGQAKDSFDQFIAAAGARGKRNEDLLNTDLDDEVKVGAQAAVKRINGQLQALAAAARDQLEPINDVLARIVEAKDQFQDLARTIQDFLSSLKG